MQVKVCRERMMEYPSELGELRDSNALLGDVAALHARMAEDGYLLLRGFLDRDTVLEARGVLFANIDEMLAEGKRPHLEATKALAVLPEVHSVLEDPRLFAFFEEFFGEPALTFPEKWLRATPPEGYTGVHYDNVYMGRGSARLHTVWTPFDDLPPAKGTLAICRGSHDGAFQKLIDTYGQMDVDRDGIGGGGWYSHDPLEVTRKFGGHWQTAHMRAGDVIVFPMFTLHCSTNNTTDELRLSCDSRFQPAGDPADERWYGPTRTGHTHIDYSDTGGMPMVEAKRRWGV